jgi:hypothetical protein
LANGSEHMRFKESSAAAKEAGEAMETLFRAMKAKTQGGPAVEERLDAAFRGKCEGANSKGSWMQRLRKWASVNVYLQVFALLTLLITCFVLFGVVSR